MGPPDQRTRIPELDGVRGWAILCVLYWHFIYCPAEFTDRPSFDILRRLGLLTWAGVDLFFVLSGFLIGGILLANRQSPNLFSVFYARRSLRIFPLYYAWILLFLLLRPLIGHHLPWLMQEPLHLRWYLTYTQNFGYAIRNEWGKSNWLAITWSLAIEEQFYLLLPLLVFCLGPKSLTGFTIGAIISSPIIRYFLTQSGHDIAAFVLLPARWDSLFLGVLGAILLSRKGAADKCRQNPTLIQTPFLILAALCALWICMPSIWRWPWLVPLQSTLMGAFSLSLIFVAMFAPWRAIFRARWLVWMGSISYGVYLIHQSISGILQALAHHPEPRLQKYGDFALVFIAMAITLLLAHVSFRYFESPLIRLGHRFRYGPRTVPQPSAAPVGD